MSLHIWRQNELSFVFTNAEVLIIKTITLLRFFIMKELLMTAVKTCYNPTVTLFLVRFRFAFSLTLCFRLSIYYWWALEDWNAFLCNNKQHFNQLVKLLKCQSHVFWNLILKYAAKQIWINIFYFAPSPRLPFQPWGNNENKFKQLRRVDFKI